MNKSFTSNSDIFSDLGFSPEIAENLNIRAYSMLQIRILIDEGQLTHDEVAEIMGIDLSQVIAAVAGKISEFESPNL